jgi:hypothetical protein
VPRSLTLFHTSRTHVERFDALLAPSSRPVAVRHLVNESILADAIRDGIIEPSVSLVEGAWERFQAGDFEEYLRLTGEAAARSAADADVIVLAQASMMGAKRYAETRLPVLTSPPIGLAHALTLL